jgi:hypothetical protein
MHLATQDAHLLNYRLKVELVSVQVIFRNCVKQTFGKGIFFSFLTFPLSGPILFTSLQIRLACVTHSSGNCKTNSFSFFQNSDFFPFKLLFSVRSSGLSSNELQSSYFM